MVKMRSTLFSFVFSMLWLATSRAQFPVHFGAMQAGCNQYESMLKAQGPSFAWRLQEKTGSTVADIMGASAGSLVSSPTLNQPGPLLTSPSTAIGLNGSSQYIYSVASAAAPTTMTLGLWFKTSTASGGRLIGYSNLQTGNSATRDRHIYMTNTGQLRFGIGANITIISPKSYNDNSWHLAIATLDGSGMKLYVDGVLVASSVSSTGLTYTGYLRVGNDNLTTWTGAPTSNFFNGQVAEPFTDTTSVFDPTRIADLYEMGRYCRMYSAPTVSAILPKQGISAGGGTVTVTGTGFVTPMEIWIAGRVCTSLNIVSTTSATCVVPANANGTSAIEKADVTVVVGARSATQTGFYGYIGAPIFWLDMTAPNSMFTNTGCTTPAVNGNQIACWKDLSGNNMNYTQATAASRPIYNTATGVDFDGTNDYMSGTVPAGVGTTATISYAGWANADTTTATYVGFIFHRGTLPATGINATTSSAQVGYHWNDTAASYGWSSGLTYSTATWTFLGLTINSTTATGYRNATTATNTTTHTALAIGGKVFDLARDNSAGRYLNGKIEKAGMWSTTLTPAQMTVIRDTR